MKKNINNNIKKFGGEGHRLLLERSADYRGEGGLLETWGDQLECLLS